ncbi:DUF6402 family protein [Xenorhabdus cabanillasii]|uniref:Uncharacterized protein n=1 Tax=Xenorhabdus cabanillasii JM26 TaxID=1427517 RepID=W1IS31_9GAMM|nr:DUF6402 family protein [Xenorhabdus cabanillasii]PHM76212.1 hypothetical protein Xcab_03273 [Xenorhabdus cabanillasii JM26]PHM77646.1 hypothetical protein Xcab_01867 [Xenorhabdus cabanillasii JM26]CDL81297.1 conserved hypothetical protein [Xenorhabdus cabanillasii JM26]
MSILKTKTVKGGETTTILFDELSLYDIPKIMDKMGWTTASALMKHWFSITPAFKFNEKIRDGFVNGNAMEIPKEQVNDSIIKMDWARRYEIITDNIEELKNIWASENGKKRLFTDIFERNKEKEVNGLIHIGYENSAIELDYLSQINYRRFGKYRDTMDELMGAIGVGTLKVAVRGYFDIKGNKKIFTVEKLGFYIKDTYDFTDEHIISEPLGIWSRQGIVPRKEVPVYMASFVSGAFGWLYKNYRGYVPVFNQDFRKWQDIHNEGGDFVVFSDVYWTDSLEKDKVIYEGY